MSEVPHTQAVTMRIVLVVHPTNRRLYSALVAVSEHSRRDTYLFGGYEGWRIAAMDYETYCGEAPQRGDFVSYATDSAVHDLISKALDLRLELFVETVTVTSEAMRRRLRGGLEDDWAKLTIARGWEAAPEDQTTRLRNVLTAEDGPIELTSEPSVCDAGDELAQRDDEIKF